MYTKLSTFTLQRKANGDGRGGEEVGTEPKKIAVARFSVPAGPGTSGGAFNFKINDKVKIFFIPVQIAKINYGAEQMEDKCFTMPWVTSFLFYIATFDRNSKN